MTEPVGTLDYRSRLVYYSISGSCLRFCITSWVQQSQRDDFRQFCSLTRERFMLPDSVFFDVLCKLVKNARRARELNPKPRCSRVDVVTLGPLGGYHPSSLLYLKREPDSVQQLTLEPYEPCNTGCCETTDTQKSSTISPLLTAEP